MELKFLSTNPSLNKSITSEGVFKLLREWSGATNIGLSKGSFTSLRFFALRITVLILFSEPSAVMMRGRLDASA